MLRVGLQGYFFSSTRLRICTLPPAAAAEKYSEKSTGPDPHLILPYIAGSVTEPIQEAKLSFFNRSFLGMEQSSVLG